MMSHDDLGEIDNYGPGTIEYHAPDDDGVIDLDTFLDRPVGVEQIIDGEDGDGPMRRFRIVDEGGAIWAMRKLSKFAADRERHAMTAAAERARIDEWLLEVNGPLVSSASYFEGLLREWHVSQIEEAAGVNVLAVTPTDAEWKQAPKTLKLVRGTSKATRARGQFTASDSETAVGWLVKHRDDLVNVTTTVSATSIARGLEDGTVEISEAGRYIARVASLPIEADNVQEIQQALGNGATLNEIIAVLARADDPEGTDDFVQWTADMQFDADVIVRLSQQLGEPPMMELWGPIPGIALTGRGLVTITPKPEA